MLVETLYRPTLKDSVSGLRMSRFYAASPQTSAASASITQTFAPVPPDTARFITSVSCQGFPGAAQTFDFAQAVVQTAGVLSWAVTGGPVVRAAAVNGGVYWLTDWLLLPGDVVLIAGTFNAGVANNSFGAWLFGYDIPRANLV